MAGRRRSQKTEYYFDYSLLFIILFLTGFGLVMIYSASAYDATTQNLNEDYYLMHQAFAAALGLVGMFFVSHIPYHFWERFAVIGYVVSLILIALVLSPLGVEVNGARRWLNLGMSIQPAEIAKLAMILFLATFICKMGRNIRTSRGFLTVIGVSLPHVFCIWKITNNLSSAIIVLGIAILMLFVASPQYKPFFIIGGIGALAVIGVIFGVKQLQAELEREVRRQRLYGTPPSLSPCTNAWVQKAELNAALTAVQARGNDPRFFCNLFLCQYGVEDNLTYTNDLFAFYQSLQGGGRRICVVNGDPAPPGPEEIAAVKRGNYASAEQLAAGLAANIRYPANVELQRLMTRAFIDLVLEEGERCGGSVSKLTSRAVYLLCWLNRYQKDLFPDWKAPEVAVFLQFGRCASDTGALFLRLLARLPVDVLLLLPNLNEGSALHTPDLLEVHCPQSVSLDRFPVDQNQARVTTAAYQAERDLDRLMYQDTGLYRNQQYAKASTVLLQTMYEEIPILWDQEMKYRPSFSAAGDTVTLPVICQKICGVKDGNASQYWLDIKKLITPDTEVVRSVPWVQGTDPNPVKPYATQFLKNGKLLRGKIKSHSAYLYGILRAEMQEHLLDKLQLLLDQKLIRGTFENGTEYTVIATALNLPKDLLRKIQKFDFTKKNPKLIYINPTEERISLEDSILTAFLSLVGFDVLFFVPTGYQCIEQHFTRPFASETQIGDYLYDLRIPDFNTVQESGLHSIRKLFGRSI